MEATTSTNPSIQSQQGIAIMEMQVPAAVINVHHAVVRPVFRNNTEFRFSPQLHAHFDRPTRALWSRWTAAPRPCFNPGLLSDIDAYYNFLADSDGQIDCGDTNEAIEYVILASGMPGGEVEGLKTLASMHPIGRIASANEIAEAAAFLASDKASFITGVVLPIDGGLTMV
jgi:hypothetical protein